MIQTQNNVSQNRGRYALPLIFQKHRGMRRDDPQNDGLMCHFYSGKTGLSVIEIVDTEKYGQILLFLFILFIFFYVIYDR
jgi:hypothetical protein